MPRSPRLLPIYLGTCFMFAALAARGFLTPLYVHDLGGDKVQVGILFSLFTITGACLSLPSGFLADRYGRRPLILFSVVVGGISQVGMAAADSVTPMFAWQVVGGLGAGAAQAALFAAVGDAAPGFRLGRAMGWTTLSMQVGFLSGPAASGLALQWLSLRGVLAASTVLYGLALVTTFFIASRPGIKRSWNLARPLRELVGRRAFAPAVAGLLGATMLWGTLQAYLPLFGKEHLQLPEAQIGYMIAIQAVANGLARIPGGRLVDRLRRRGLVVIVGILAFAVSLSLLPHMSGFLPTTVLLVVAVPFVATAILALGVIFSSLATDESRGVAMGMYSMVLFIGLGIGPAIFGAVMEHSGYLAGFTACAATGVLLAGLVAVLRREWFPRQQAAALPPAS